MGAAAIYVWRADSIGRKAKGFMAMDDPEEADTETGGIMDDRATISSRKDDHVRLAQKFAREYPAGYQKEVYRELDGCEFIHRALPETSIDEVDISTCVAGIAQPSPIFINAMTGGTEATNKINMALAQAASRTGIAMALGSMSILVKKPEVRDYYSELREANPHAKFIANLGAEHTAKSAQLVVDAVGAQALQIHVNAAQEIVMPEGSRDFRGWLRNIREITAAMGGRKVPVPVIVKEVGFGMGRETVAALHEAGVRYVDIAGKGGTNFIRIEDTRIREAARGNCADATGKSSENTDDSGCAGTYCFGQDFSYLQGWGISALRSLVEARSVDGMDIIASGGVRNPLDAVKYLALGAQAVGLSGAFLSTVQGGDTFAGSGGDSGIGIPVSDDAAARLTQFIEVWNSHITRIFTLLGAHSIADLQATAHMVYPQSLVEYCRQRDIALH